MRFIISVITTSLFLAAILGFLFVLLVTGQTSDSSVRIQNQSHLKRVSAPSSEPVSTGQLNVILGQVTDEQEHPLADYVLEAISLLDGVTYSMKTTQDGRFRLSNLQEGVWYLNVKFNGSTIEHRKITLSKDMKLEMNFTIKAAGKISGFLLDSASQAPLNISGDIHVGLLTEFDTVERFFHGRVSGGSFEVKNLLPGRYIVMDSFRGFVFDMPKAPEVTIYPKGNVGGIEVLLRQGALVHGRVMNTSKQPISGVTVKVASAKLHTIEFKLEFSRSTQTDDRGEFFITTPSEPEIYYSFSVMVNHPKYQAQIIHIDLRQDQSEYELPEIVMQETLILKGKISNPVTPSSGQLKVILRRHNKPVDFFAFYARLDMEVYADINGNFIFEGLYPTEYSMSISMNGVTRYFMESVNPQKQSYLEIRLAKTQVLRGHVMNVDNQPLEGVRIDATMKIPDSAASSISLSSCKTGPDGLFRLEVLKVSPEYLTVRVSKSGYLSNVYRNIRITKEELLVILKLGSSIKGYVFTPCYLPLDDSYSIKLFPADLSMETVIDPFYVPIPIITEIFRSEESGFSIDGLPPEKYNLFVVSKQFAATGTTIDVTLGDQKAFLFVKETTTALHGRVLWADTGKPITGALVRRSWYPWELEIYDTASSMERFEVETDENGIFEFLNLTPGRYFFRISYSDILYKAASGSSKRNIIHKQVELTVGNSSEPYTFYLGRRDGSSLMETKM